jgi:hypothetical protein
MLDLPCERDTLLTQRGAALEFTNVRKVVAQRVQHTHDPARVTRFTADGKVLNQESNGWTIGTRIGGEIGKGEGR